MTSGSKECRKDESFRTDRECKIKRQPSKDLTINSVIGLINEWFYGYLNSNGCVHKEPLVKLEDYEVEPSQLSMRLSRLKNGRRS